MFFRKNSKISAYEALVKYQVHQLPVTSDWDKTANIKIFTLQYLANYFHEPVDTYLKSCNYRGIIFYQAEYDRYVAFVNADDPVPLLRWTISVAIGYIENNRAKSRSAFYLGNPSRYVEDFAYVFACPDCILREREATECNDIVRICQVPLSVAREKSKRLKLDLPSRDSRELKLEELLKMIFLSSND